MSKTWNELTPVQQDILERACLQQDMTEADWVELSYLSFAEWRGRDTLHGHWWITDDGFNCFMSEDTRPMKRIEDDELDTVKIEYDYFLVTAEYQDDTRNQFVIRQPVWNTRPGKVNWTVESITEAEYLARCSAEEGQEDE